MRRTHIFVLLSIWLAGCATPEAPSSNASGPTTAPGAPTTNVAAPVVTTPVASVAATSVVPAPAAAPPPPVVLAFDEAVLMAAKQALDGGAAQVSEKAVVVIDPLIDGASGAQTVATQIMGQRLAQIARTQYPKLEVRGFSGKAVAELPFVLIGTFTPINLAGKPDGERDMFRVCFAMIDLKSGKIVSKGFARAKTDGVDHTPLALYRDGPVWVVDPEVNGYVRTCQGTKAGDPINPAYVDAVMAAALIDEAYQTLKDNARTRDAIALYNTALKNPRGQQARVFAGLYAAHMRQRQPAEAMKAFGRLLDMGLAQNRLAAQFQFAATNTAFEKDQRMYDGWLREIGQRLVKSNQCIEIGGHVSRSANEAISDRLSQQRAEFVRQRLVAQVKPLSAKSVAVGHGFRHNIVGTGSNDHADVFDRRIEFKPKAC